MEQPLTKFPVPTDSPKLHEVSELMIMKLLATLNPSKTCGPDEIPNWLLKEYAELLAFPVSKIINSSFKEQRLPKIWKFADVSPLPKVKPVEDLKKLYSTANDPQPQMIPRPQMILKMDRK